MNKHLIIRFVLFGFLGMGLGDIHTWQYWYCLVVALLIASFSEWAGRDGGA